jgi:hypothetical protein
MQQVFQWLGLSLLWLLGTLFMFFQLSPLTSGQMLLVIATLGLGLGMAGRCAEERESDREPWFVGLCLLGLPLVLIGELLWLRVHLVTVLVVVSCSLVGAWLAWQRLQLEAAHERVALANQELRELMVFREVTERTQDRLNGLTGEYVDTVKRFLERSR